MVRHDRSLIFILSIPHLVSSLTVPASSLSRRRRRRRRSQLFPYRESSTVLRRRPTRPLYATTRIGEADISTPTTSTNVCIVYNDEEQNHQFDFLSPAREIAASLDCPLLPFSEWNSVTSNYDSDQKLYFTHILRLVPYHYKDEDEITLLSTYALAIEESPVARGTIIDSLKKTTTTTPAGLARKRTRKMLLSKTPFYVDLCPPRASRAGRRISSASGTSDLLVKAVAPSRGDRSHHIGPPKGATIYDLTAGLGQDSLLLAMNGAHHVHMVERDPIVAALLRDALRRLDLIANASQGRLRLGSQSDPTSSSDYASLLRNKLSLTVGEGREVIERRSDAHDTDVDVVYLDPMFPPRQKSAAVKKGMQLLQGLLERRDFEGGSNISQQEQELLQSAWMAAKLRVVVKRPIKAPPLGVQCDGNGQNDESLGARLKPSFAITGSVNRWDVYVKPTAPS